jgi:predicted GNAT family acetyltransferase
MRDPETNQLYYIDYSKNNVYDTLSRPFQTILRNIQEGVEDEEVLLKGFVKGVAQAAGQVAEPFVSEAMFTEAFMDIVSRNGVTNEGVELYSDQTPDVEKYQRIFKHLGKTLMPTTKPFQRLSKAITDTPSSTGEFFEIGPEMAGVMGWKPVKVEPERALGFYIYDFQRGISKARKEFTGGPEGLLKGGPKTPEDIIQRYFVANQAMFNVQKEMLTHFMNAQKIGMSRSQIKKSLEKRGIPESTIDDLLKGKFKFFYPSEKIQERFKEISRETGTPNAFLQAQGVVKAMRNSFKGMSLYRDFNMELSDFMPGSNDDQSSLPTPPLPNTPMPAKMAQNTQRTNPITNLTSTEEAVLSPTGS